MVYGTLIRNGKTIESIEVYSGKNYIVGSTDVSHSRCYCMHTVPKYLKSIVAKLKEKHSKTKWSKRRRVNLN